MSTIWDQFTGDNSSNILSQAGAGAGAIDYPGQDVVNVFGTIYTPRVYGKDMSALEIASSGLVTIALNDVHAIDFANAAGVTTLTSASNNAFLVLAGSNASMESLSNSVTLYADNRKVYLELDQPSDSIIGWADNSILLTASTGTLSNNAGQDILSTAGNNIFNNAAGGWMSNNALLSVSITAGSNVSITGTEGVEATASTGDITGQALLGSITNTAHISLSNVATEGSIVNLATSGSFSNSALNVYIAAAGAFSNTAASLNNQVTGDAISTFGGSFSNSASNQVYLNANSNIFKIGRAHV